MRTQDLRHLRHYANMMHRMKALSPHSDNCQTINNPGFPLARERQIQNDRIGTTDEQPQTSNSRLFTTIELRVCPSKVPQVDHTTEGSQGNPFQSIFDINDVARRNLPCILSQDKQVRWGSL
jgi:hypothetical protein